MSDADDYMTSPDLGRGHWSRRLFDLAAASLGLIVLSPLFLVLGAVIRAEDGGAIFFRQERVGLHGKGFSIWKFRTMVDGAEQVGRRLTVGDDIRITKVGGFLRRLKLDELPQLLNVVRGEMSVVGPRPEVPHYVELYDPDQRRILSLRPGITDPASLRFNDESALLATADDPEEFYVSRIMPEKIRLSLVYAEQATLMSDIRVTLATLWRLLGTSSR